MTQNISRRSVTSGVAWSLPAVAVATAAPALASSVPPAGCTLTDAQLNAGACNVESWQLLGALNYATTNSLTTLTTASAFALKSTCNYKGSVTVYFYDPANQLGGQVPPATLTLADGSSYQGRGTLGTIGTGVAQTGWDMFVSMQWLNAGGTATSGGAYSKDWTGATVVIPFDLYYTAPDGSLHTCQYKLTYTMTHNNKWGIYAKMGTPTLSLR